MPLVATEVGPWNADVMGIDDRISIEVEIKKSRSDLLADFRNKVAKHWQYQNAKKGQPFVPSYLYFLVPKELGTSTVELIKEKAPKAGVAALIYPAAIPYGAGHGIEVLKPARRLHDGKPDPRFLKTIQMRMGSEICGLRLALENLKKTEVTAALIQEVVAMAKSASTTADLEAAFEAAIGEANAQNPHGSTDQLVPDAVPDPD